MARILSVNVGSPRTVTWHGREITSAIWKSPVEGAVPLRGVNLAGDDQSDREVHGGPNKAVYAYASEDYAWWAETHPEAANGTGYGPGTFGENLTTEGLVLAEQVIGTRWRVGSTTLEVRQPRFPCAKLGMRMGDAGFRELFGEARRSGTYLGVVEEGEISAGDAVEVLSVPDHEVRVIDLVEAQRRDVSSALLERVVATPAVMQSYRETAQRALDRRAAAG